MNKKRRWTITGICVILILAIAGIVWITQWRKAPKETTTIPSQSREWTEPGINGTEQGTTTVAHELPGLTVQGEPLQ